MGHCWRSRDKLISDIFLWTSSHGRAKAGWPARTYIQQLCADTGCSLEDLPGAMDDRDGWWERVREIRSGGAIWWWGCIWLHMSTYKKAWLPATYRNILVNNTKILHTDNNIRKLKFQEALYIKFRQPPINRINFKTDDDILKCLKQIEQSIDRKKIDNNREKIEQILF